LESGFGGDSLLALDDLADHLQRPAHALGESGLRHAELFESFGKRFAGRDGVIRLEEIVGV
jgi:hypothetical protein